MCKTWVLTFDIEGHPIPIKWQHMLVLGWGGYWSLLPSLTYRYLSTYPALASQVQGLLSWKDGVHVQSCDNIAVKFSDLLPPCLSIQSAGLDNEYSEMMRHVIVAVWWCRNWDPPSCWRNPAQWRQGHRRIRHNRQHSDWHRHWQELADTGPGNIYTNMVNNTNTNSQTKRVSSPLFRAS